MSPLNQRTQDVGDNYRKRGTVQIYRMEEPKVERGRNRNDDIRQPDLADLPS